MDHSNQIELSDEPNQHYVDQIKSRLISSQKDTPSFSEFDPTVIPWQHHSITDIWQNYDYNLGVHEVLASGTLGSAKSTWLSNQITWHMLQFPKSRILIGRKVRADLEDTILKNLLEHWEGDFEEGEDYEWNKAKNYIKFSNGSEIISRSWHKKNWKQFRSLKLSMAAIEELSENDDDHWEFYSSVKQRVGRLPYVPMNLMISCTNPDDPGHPVYDHFFVKKSPTKHVYYSITEDNPFLNKWYIENLKEDLSPKMAQRLLYGKWVSIGKNNIYESYDADTHYKKTDYLIDPDYPIDIAWDFNIGHGKPLSCFLGQVIGDHFHIFDEVVIDGARTVDSLDEIAGRGYFDKPYHFRIHGDATGNSRHTSSKLSDYEVIESFLKSYRKPISYRMCVPRSNPPVRTRHNRVNSYLKNELKQVRLTLYIKCITLDKGLRLTALKKGSGYIEDDSKREQHITTALGYWIVYQTNSQGLRKIRSQRAR